MRSKFVGMLGWLSVAVSVLLGVAGVFEFAVSRMVQGNPDLAIQMGLALQQQTGQFVDMNSLPSQLGRQALTHGILGVLGLAVAIGLIKRREWARKVTIALIAIVTLASAPALLWGSLPPQVPRWLTMGSFALAAAVHVGIIRRLLTPEVRAEFQR